MCPSGSRLYTPSSRKPSLVQCPSLGLPRSPGFPPFLPRSHHVAKPRSQCCVPSSLAARHHLRPSLPQARLPWAPGSLPSSSPPLLAGCSFSVLLTGSSSSPCPLMLGVAPKPLVYSISSLPWGWHQAFNPICTLTAPCFCLQPGPVPRLRAPPHKLLLTCPLTAKAHLQLTSFRSSSCFKLLPPTAPLPSSPFFWFMRPKISVSSFIPFYHPTSHPWGKPAATLKYTPPQPCHPLHPTALSKTSCGVKFGGLLTLVRALALGLFSLFPT